MRSNKAIFIGLLVMLLGAVLVMGCGDADPLDELPLRYTVSMSTTDLGEATRDVDVVQDVCDSDAEDFGDFGAIVTIVADEDTADLIVYGYTVTFTPRTGTYAESDEATPSVVTWTNFTPPPALSPYTNLSPIVHNYNTPLVMQNGILEDIPLLMWDPAAKYFYVYTVLQTDYGLNGIFYDGLGVAYAIEAETIGVTYDYRVVFHCHDSEDGNFDLEAWEVVNLSNRDNC